ncbi:MAG TPA: glycosyltransferase [Clostridia bacterium]|nr:glycosyltransferase [Clostridia bacterium]
MRILMFYHTLLSDWNHGNAHFLRGIATELLARGHEVQVLEPRNSWSANSLLREQGLIPFRKFHAAYPGLKAVRYDPDSCDLEEVLDGADVVIVHEWNDPGLVSRIGGQRSRAGGFRLYFHDTHHRMVTDPQSMSKYDLSSYDGVLAYGNVLKELYETGGRVQRAWTWHEAADTRVFHPLRGGNIEGDVVWIGNWGDEERTSELQEFLIEPCRSLGLNARVYGVRYPQTALHALAVSGIHYAGWLPNFEVPRVFSQFHITVHIPRRPYVNALPGIPTIRPFEALACGIPLVSSPWHDAEGLFTPGSDFLVARGGQEMKQHLRTLLADHELRSGLAANGLRTILARHTCAHRVDELLAIDASVRGNKPRRKNVPLNV